MRAELKIRDPLRPYQESGILGMQKILTARHAVLLGDEMGLGKTRQTIELCSRMLFANILIVCPAILRRTWAYELNRWGNLHPLNQPFVIMKGKDIADCRAANPKVVILSYDLTRSAEVLDYLAGRRWDVLILDEAHRLSNSKTQQTKNCLKTLWKVSRKKILLSGTPVRNDIASAFTLFNACAPEVFPNYWEFCKRYTNAKRELIPGINKWVWKFEGGRNLEELRKTIRSRFFIRRTKRMVLTELPPKNFSVITFPLEYRSQLGVDDRAQLRVDSDGIVRGGGEHIATERRLLGVAKIPSTVEYIHSLLAENPERSRLVIFAYHRDVISGLEVALRDYYRILTIHGETSMNHRQQSIEEFQRPSAVQTVLLGQISAAGVGITLTSASLCVFCELSWSCVENSQAVDRLHRLGQTSVVDCHILLAEGTVDQDVYRAIVDKMKDIREVMK